MKNSFFCHYWLDPESREWLKILNSGFRDCVIIGKMSFRTNVRNLKILILLVIKISRFTRNDKKENYDTVSSPE